MEVEVVLLFRKLEDRRRGVGDEGAERIVRRRRCIAALWWVGDGMRMLYMYVAVCLW